MKTFTVFWLDGKREVLQGKDGADSFNRAGYGHGALGAVDFVSNGDDHSYVWIKDPDTGKNVWAKQKWIHTIYWKNGETRVIRGLTRESALKHCGVPEDYLKREMFMCTVGYHPDRYVYNSERRVWDKIQERKAS